MFIQSFKMSVHDVVQEDTVRITLLSCLSDKIQVHIVGAALNKPGLYQYALKELERKLGNPQVVSQACTLSLRKLQPFRGGDYQTLCHFSSTLRSLIETLRLGGYGMELQSNTTLIQLVAKLPASLRKEWGKRS